MKQANVCDSIYINRELSWLKFNERVLEEAADQRVPLFERLRFISIFINNLDEFFMIRVGSLQDQMLMDKLFVDNKTQMAASEQIEAVVKSVRSSVMKKDVIYNALMEEFAKYGVRLLRIEELSVEDEAYAHDFYKREIFPLLSPQIIDNRHPFPFLANKGIYVGVYFLSHHDLRFGIIPAVGAFERYCILPGEGIRFVLVEDIIKHFSDSLFGAHKIVGRTVFRVTRNADIFLDDSLFDEDNDFRLTMKEQLKKRNKLAPVRLEVQGELKKEFIEYLCGQLKLESNRVFTALSPLEMTIVNQLEERMPKELRKKLLFEPLVPQRAQMVTPGVPIMDQALQKDILLSYPYESMRPLIALLDEAAMDADVVSIKITLYRVGKESKIIRSLIAAAENGKDVTTVVELRARFDEEHNIEWATRLSEAGCRVIYGVDEFKVHSKVLLITRKAGKNIQYITQIGTGNYNEGTARLYTDFALITSHPEVGMDAVALFNDILVGNLTGQYKHLLVAPSSMRSSIMNKIDEEIAFAQRGERAQVQAKFNSLTDKLIIDKLLEASKAGVEVRLIVRGICCLRPGVAGKTDNIKIISIVGRFLEHSRVYCFGDGERRSVYISSADWMTRNTERRIEVACPLLDRSIADRVMRMFEMNFKDNVKARILMNDGAYLRANDTQGALLDSQLALFREAYSAAATAIKAKAIDVDRNAAEPEVNTKFLHKLIRKIKRSKIKKK